MELAVHLRHPDQLKELDQITALLLGLYGDLDPEVRAWLRSIPDRVERLYVGDEFCIHRMPDAAALEALMRTADTSGCRVTLLTPPVTDEGLERCASLFRLLETQAPDAGAEVVANDWGLLAAVRERHPRLTVAAGRLLNKGFKDPRLADAPSVAGISGEAEALLAACTFDVSPFEQKMRALGVGRLERDLFPYGEVAMKIVAGLGASLYFPFGCISTGRVCWIASFEAPAGRRFRPVDACRRPCNGLLLELGGAASQFRLFEGGNTVFYLYPPSALRSLATDEAYENVRLVCQGLAI